MRGETGSPLKIRQLIANFKEIQILWNNWTLRGNPLLFPISRKKTVDKERKGSNDKLRSCWLSLLEKLIFCRRIFRTTFFQIYFFWDNFWKWENCLEIFFTLDFWSKKEKIKLLEENLKIFIFWGIEMISGPSNRF